jgi:hypothetical protein
MTHEGEIQSRTDAMMAGFAAANRIAPGQEADVRATVETAMRDEQAKRRDARKAEFLARGYSEAETASIVEMTGFDGQLLVATGAEAAASMGAKTK